MALHYNAGNDLQLSIKMCKQHRERMGQRERGRGETRDHRMVNDINDCQHLRPAIILMEMTTGQVDRRYGQTVSQSSEQFH